MDRERKIMVRVPEELHKAVKIKAVEYDLPVSEIVRRFLIAWVSNAIQLPDKKENESPKRE